MLCKKYNIQYLRISSKGIKRKHKLQRIARRIYGSGPDIYEYTFSPIKQILTV
jgi:hypothetical protein